MSKSIDTVVSVAKLARLDLTEGLAPDEAERKLALFAAEDYVKPLVKLFKSR